MCVLQELFKRYLGGMTLIRGVTAGSPYLDVWVSVAFSTGEYSSLHRKCFYIFTKINRSVVCSYAMLLFIIYCISFLYYYQLTNPQQ